MEALLALAIGLLTATGLYLMLRQRTFPVILGLTFLSYAVNLFLFTSGRLAVNAAPIIGQTDTPADPLPQALVLTAIVITMAVAGFVLSLAYRSFQLHGHDEVADDVEDARIRELAEADVASESYEDTTFSDSGDEVSE